MHLWMSLTKNLKKNYWAAQWSKLKTKIENSLYFPLIATSLLLLKDPLKISIKNYQYKINKDLYYYQNL